MEYTTTRWAERDEMQYPYALYVEGPIAHALASHVLAQMPETLHIQDFRDRPAMTARRVDGYTLRQGETETVWELLYTLSDAALLTPPAVTLRCTLRTDDPQDGALVTHWSIDADCKYALHALDGSYLHAPTLANLGD